MNEHVTLQELVDLEMLQDVQDAFADIAQLASVVVDPNGLPITTPSNLNGMCALMQTNDKTAIKCVHTNGMLIKESMKTKQPSVLVCPHSGLTTASVPIFVDNTLVGSWILGQVRMCTPSESMLEDTAKLAGVAVTVLKEATDVLPVTTTAQFDSYFKCLIAFTGTLIQLARAEKSAINRNKMLNKVAEDMSLMSRTLTIFSDSSDAAMYVCDYESGSVMMANEKMSMLIGLNKDDMLFNNLRDVACESDIQDGLFLSFPYDKIDAASCAEEGEKIVEEIFVRRTKLWWRRTVQPIRWVDGQVALVMTYLDITKERVMRDKLKNLAYYDREMNLPNLTKLINDYESDGKDGDYLICLDVKELRRINDAYGRHTGDRLLAKIVDCMAEKTSRKFDVYRIEGDSFCVYLKGVAAGKVNELAQNIQKDFDFEWAVDIDGEIIYLFCKANICTVDIGIALNENDDLPGLISRALDAADTCGGFTMYSVDSDNEFRKHLMLELSLKNAVGQNMQGFSLNYQPIVCAKTQSWCGVEALCRWTSPEFGFVSPDVFIKEAESLGLMGTLGQWVIETAVKQCKEWGLDKEETFLLEVNVSPVQIANTNFENIVLGIIEKYDFPGENLCLEITESRELDINEQMKKSLNSLRAKGISIALDDFGIGYSSFQSLRDAPANILKTERQFVLNIETDEYIQNLFSAMVKLGHLSDKKLVSEGIETKEQLNIAVNCGTDYIQGYYYSKPLPAHELEKVVDKFKSV